MSTQEICFECGIVSIISLIIITIIGIIAQLRFFKYRNKNLLYLGIALVFMWSPWWPSSISFLIYLFISDGLSFPLYIFIGNFFFPVSGFFWLIFILNVFKVESKKQKVILMSYLIYTAIYEIFIIYWVFNPNQLGFLRNALVPAYGLELYLFILIIVSIEIVTGLLFAIDMLKAKEQEFKLKGYILIVAFSLAIFGVMLEIFTLGNLWLLISRIVIVISVFLIYIGFFLPERIKKIFIKE